MKRLFFSVSNDLLGQITDLYDFVWPTASAMWNFRWQVKGFVNEVGKDNVSDHDLLNRFDWGSGIHGVNLKRACLENTWDEQQDQFAKFLLINFCALYEGWIESIQSVLGFSDKYIKELQFPPSMDKAGKPWGVRNAINQITAKRSALILNDFYPMLITHNKNSLAQLDNLLLCYRFFKECRNCLVHQGGMADRKAEDSYLSFHNIASPANLNVYEVPQHYPAVKGNPIQMPLRGVVGFGDVVIKIVATLDAELSVSQQAEHEFVNRVRDWANNARGIGKTSLKKDPYRRSGQILRILKSLDFPPPLKTDKIESLLIRENILKKDF
jgi:hypothetical protein